MASATKVPAPRVRRGPEIETADRGRFYVWRGERYWSVTTLIGGGVPKPALIGWAKKFTAEYAVAHLATLNTLVADDPVGAVDWLKGASFRDRDKRADLGSRVHEAAEAYALGAPWPEWSEDEAPYLRAFLRWLEEFAPEFVAVEAPVFSRQQRYAGTLDAIVDVRLPDLARRSGLDPDRPLRLLIDYKTGGVYPEVALQLAAYRFAETFIGLPSADEAPLPEVDGCAVLHLQPEAYEFLPVRAEAAEFNAFLYAREVYRFTQELAPSVIGRTIQPEEVAS
jgi:hypothetical protein